MEYPPKVQICLEFIHTCGFWHKVSKNPPVRSCREAKHHRLRLEHRGIPLRDELKSNIGLCKVSGKPQYVAVHCRGHQEIDQNKLERFLGAQFRRLEKGELLDIVGAEYGAVTPFALAHMPEVRHIVDPTVLHAYSPPFTMMTNLGHLEYAVEFRPQEVFSTLPRTEFADVVRDGDVIDPAEHQIGILTGNSPESGILLWQRINRRIREKLGTFFRGDISLPRVIVESAPGMGLSMELTDREAEVRSVVIEGVTRLCDSGASVLGIACNTTQYFADEVEAVCANYGAVFVRMADETGRYLRAEGIQQFDFVGIGPVTDFERFSGFGKALSAFDVTVPSNEDIAEIRDFAFRVKREVVTGKTVSDFRRLINKRTSDVVVMALTELSILADSQSKQKSSKRVVDTLDVLARRIADVYLHNHPDIVPLPM